MSKKANLDTIDFLINHKSRRKNKTWGEKGIADKTVIIKKYILAALKNCMNKLLGNHVKTLYLHQKKKESLSINVTKYIT